MNDNKAEQPVAYTSRIMSYTEHRYIQTEKKGLTIIYDIQKFYDGEKRHPDVPTPWTDS